MTTPPIGARPPSKSERASTIAIQSACPKLSVAARSTVRAGAGASAPAPRKKRTPPRNAEEPDRAGDGDPHIDTGEEFRPGKRGPARREPLDLRPGGEADRGSEAEESGDHGEAPGGIRPLRQDRACEEQERSGELRGGPRRPGERLRPRPGGQDCDNLAPQVRGRGVREAGEGEGREAQTELERPPSDRRNERGRSFRGDQLRGVGAHPPHGPGVRADELRHHVVLAEAFPMLEHLVPAQPDGAQLSRQLPRDRLREDDDERLP